MCVGGTESVCVCVSEGLSTPLVAWTGTCFIHPPSSHRLPGPFLSSCFFSLGQEATVGEAGLICPPSLPPSLQLPVSGCSHGELSFSVPLCLKGLSTQNIPLFQLFWAPDYLARTF